MIPSFRFHKQFKISIFEYISAIKVILILVMIMKIYKSKSQINSLPTFSWGANTLQWQNEAQHLYEYYKLPKSEQVRLFYENKHNDIKPYK